MYKLCILFLIIFRNTLSPTFYAMLLQRIGGTRLFNCFVCTNNVTSSSSISPTPPFQYLVIHTTKDTCVCVRLTCPFHIYIYEVIEYPYSPRSVVPCDYYMRSSDVKHLYTRRETSHRRRQSSHWNPTSHKTTQTPSTNK